MRHASQKTINNVGIEVILNVIKNVPWETFGWAP